MILAFMSALDLQSALETGAEIPESGIGDVEVADMCSSLGQAHCTRLIISVMVGG